MFPEADLAVARRLERAEAMANAAFVDARAMLQPNVGAEWIEVAGAYAMFDGVGSPLTQTFGVGVFDSCAGPEFERLEQFFAGHAAATAHEISSFAHADTLRVLSSRGYSPIEASVVLVQPAARRQKPVADRIVVRRIDESDAALWSRVSVEGWSSELPDLAPFFEALGAVITRARGAYCFLAEIDTQPIAAAALNVQNGIALLAGASTIPTARRQGAQQALLDARLAFAGTLGVELAMVVTAPGSASQRNAERQGFRPLYTRSKWQRQLP